MFSRESDARSGCWTQVFAGYYFEARAERAKRPSAYLQKLLNAFSIFVFNPTPRYFLWIISDNESTIISIFSSLIFSFLFSLHQSKEEQCASGGPPKRHPIHRHIRGSPQRSRFRGADPVGSADVAAKSKIVALWGEDNLQCRFAYA